MQRTAVIAFALGLAGVALAPGRPAASQNTVATPEQAQLFEKSVRPVLFESCVNCHNKDNALGGLRLDVPVTLAKAQEIVKRIKATDPKLRMPQGGAALAPAKVAAMESWVKAGAPWPANVAAPTRAPLWSLQPVKKPQVPVVKLKAWLRNPIDNFVLAKVEGAKLKPAAYADRRTLIRRASYELTGLPPSADEIDTFVSDTSADAWPKVVDRILASPRYGERMARFWMDVARYADTKGYVFTDDRNYYHAYTYREWLIQSFNEGMPYDQFLQYQLAADRMDIGEERRHLAALGYLTLGRRFINNIHDIIDDRIDVTMRGMQAMTVACARCHDHKFDPIPSKDYYGLYAVFASSQENQPIISAKAIREPYEKHDGQFQAAKNEYDGTVQAQVGRLRGLVKDKPDTVSEPVKKTLQGFREGEFPPADKLAALTDAFEPEKRTRLEELRKRMDELKKSYPPTPEFAHAMSEGAPYGGKVFKRGNPDNPGDPAPRHFLTCVAGESQTEWPDGGRLELAKAISDKSNPLTARVIANRIWLLHFGQGIVRTPSDFGRQGDKPTHPELLDYLADTLMNEDGWGLKKLQRRILLSATWMQSSDCTEAVFQKDPDNRLLTRQTRRRLEMEPLRDSLLLASGQLDLGKLGGKSEELWTGNYTKRRAVYGFIERQNLPGIFKTLDFATPDVSSPQRFKTIVPQQTLFLMNSPLVSDQARALVKLPEVSAAPDEETKIKVLYRRLFGRLPSKNELDLGLTYVIAPDKATFSPDAEARVWRYGWGVVDMALGRTSEFHDFTTFIEGQWRAGAQLPDPKIGWAFLNKDGGHPGDLKHMVIRRWISPFDGIVKVSGNLTHPGKVGDGVRGRLVHSRLGVLGEWVAQDGSAETNIASVEIKRGETLDFVVDCRTTENTDAFVWAPNVVQPGAKRLVWRADRDFSGPMAPAAPPLNKWERYAQALLMTNEFIYVD